jgi:acetyl esterase/lipase
MMLSALLLLLAQPVLAGPSTVTYRTVGDAPLLMDVYPAVGVTGPAPCVVVIHGGAWISGQRSDMDALSKAISDAGMVVANIDYRLAPKDKWPAMIEDCQAAVRYVRDHAKELGVDPKRIGAAGASAGGHLSLLLGTTDGWPDGTKTATSSKVSAVLNLFGPFDCSQDFSVAIGMLLSQSLIGKKYEDCTEDIKLFSPATYVTKDDAPVFTVQGKADPTVPFHQAERLDTALKAVGVSSTLRLIDGMKHGIDPSHPEEMKAVADGVAWLKARLAG